MHAELEFAGAPAAQSVQPMLQWWTSDVVSYWQDAAPHPEKPALHLNPHWLLTHVAELLSGVAQPLQPPQWFGSEVVSYWQGEPPQAMKPVLQVYPHWLLEHVAVL